MRLSEELTLLSAKRMTELVRSKSVSPVELVEAHLERIERLNPRLNAIVTLAPDALARAKEIEASIIKGDVTSALAGLPITIKDTIQTANLRTTFGSRVFQDYVPQKDAPAIVRLRKAGAIVIGKTNTSELALDYTAENPVFGRTNNPFDEGRSPGGSSGGCAAAVCACLSAGSLGSDLSGSLRIPAHFCGVVGLRPTTERVPGGGHLPPIARPFAIGGTLGPIARRVEDVAMLFHVLASADMRFSFDQDESLDIDAAAANMKGLKVGWYADDGAVPVTRETRRALEAAAKVLSEEGASVCETRPPHIEHATKVWLELFSHATQSFLQKTFEGRESDAGPVAKLLLERAKRKRELSLADYFEVWTKRDQMRDEMLAWMEETPLLIAPVGAISAVAHNTHKVSTDGENSFSLFSAFGYAQAFSVFDLPSITVRAGWSAEGLPIGVQIVGRPFQEHLILKAAHLVESALGGWEAVPQNLSKKVANPL